MNPATLAALSPSYAATADIPVLIDDVKSLEDFHVTRCTYFTIDAGAAVDDWVALLRGRGIPFLLLGVSAVIFRPELDVARFEDPDQIDSLFHRIEQIGGVVVETAHIWLPNELFGEHAARAKSPGDDHNPLDRGALWRVSLPLFQSALKFQKEVITLEQFTEDCRLLMSAERSPLAHTPKEWRVFHEWSQAQIEAARLHYQEQKKDPERQVLDWRDEYGELRSG